MANGEGLHLSPKAIGVVVGSLIAAIVGSNVFTGTVTKGISNNTADEMRGVVLTILEEDRTTYTEEELEEQFQERKREEDVDLAVSEVTTLKKDVSLNTNQLSILGARFGVLQNTQEEMQKTQKEGQEEILGKIEDLAISINGDH